MRYKCRACLYEFESNNEIPYCPVCENEGLNEVCDDITKKEEAHHIHPRFMDNKNGSGQIYSISKRKHSMLHGLIMKWLWEEVKDKEMAIKNIIRKSKEFIGVSNG